MGRALHGQLKHDLPVARHFVDYCQGRPVTEECGSRPGCLAMLVSCGKLGIVDSWLSGSRWNEPITALGGASAARENYTSVKPASSGTSQLMASSLRGGPELRTPRETDSSVTVCLILSREVTAHGGPR